MTSTADTIASTLPSIGGGFGLEDVAACNGTPPPFLAEPALLLANASSGLLLVVERLSPRRIWLPSFLCSAVVKAVGAARKRIRYYPIESNLTVAQGAWLDSVTSDDLVVVIDYFGFQNDFLHMIAGRAKRPWILEDASQALLSSGLGRFADFVVMSPRKCVGVPDGGILISKRKIGLEELGLASPPLQWWLTALEATVLRRQDDKNNEWYPLFRKVEETLPIGAFRMSELSEALLRHCFDYGAIADKRRSNFAYLNKRLAGLAVLPELPEGVVPLGFPIKLANRDAVRQRLFDSRIFPAVHWSLPETVPQHFKASRQLSAAIMTLPCDQRYDKNDMERLCRAVKQAL